MRRYSLSAFAIFALFTASTLLFPAHLLAAEKKARPEVVPENIVRVKERANVRGGPDTSYKKLWTATKYTPLEVLCRYKQWYVVRDFENFVGWVHVPVVEKGPALIVKVKQALARSGPGPDESPIWNVPKGYPLKVLKKKGAWFHVEDDAGEKAWIHKSVVWGSTK